jgi:hypothetical protein
MGDACWGHFTSTVTEGDPVRLDNGHRQGLCFHLKHSAQYLVPTAGPGDGGKAPLRREVLCAKLGTHRARAETVVLTNQAAWSPLHSSLSFLSRKLQ